jgi:hypothetical protein
MAEGETNSHPYVTFLCPLHLRLKKPVPLRRRAVLREVQPQLRAYAEAYGVWEEVGPRPLTSPPYVPRPIPSS